MGPLDTSAAGVGIFVLDYTDDALLSRIDLVTGAVTFVPIVDDLGVVNSAIGVIGSGSSAAAYSSDDVGGTDAVTCSDGTVWVATGSLGATKLVHEAVHPDAAGADVIATVQLPAAVQLEPAEIAGTTANCLPIFTGPDGRGYVIEMTGAVMRLDEGLLVSADGGFSAEETCTGSGRCALVLHGAAGSIVTLPAGGPFSQVAFDHGGTRALVVASVDRGAFAYVHGDVQLVDMATGSVTTLAVPSGEATSQQTTSSTVPAATDSTASSATDSSTPSSAPSVSVDSSAAGARPDAAAIVNPVRSARFGRWARWSPDDSIAVVSTGDRLFRVDAASKTASAFATAAGFERGAEILAIA